MKIIVYGTMICPDTVDALELFKKNSIDDKSTKAFIYFDTSKIMPFYLYFKGLKSSIQLN